VGAKHEINSPKNQSELTDEDLEMMIKMWNRKDGTVLIR